MWWSSSIALCIGVLLLGSAAAADRGGAAFDGSCTELPPAALTIGEAWKRLDACNRDLVAARRAVASAEADLAIAGQRPNPTVSAGVGSINPTLGIGPGNLTRKTVDTSVRLEQVIERGGKPTLRRLTAERLLEAARLDLAEMRRQQGGATLTAMVDLAAAAERVALLTDVTQLYDQAARVNAQRLARGDIARIDTQRQALDALRAQADLRQSEGDLRRARVALASLLAWESMQESLSADVSALEALDMHRSLHPPGDRADVRAARRRVEAAAAARDLARAQSRADVTVGFQFDHYPSSPGNPNGTGNTYSVSASIPLLVRHRYQGEIAKAESDYAAAQEALRRATASAESEWTRSGYDIVTAVARARLLQESIAPQAEEVARATETGYAKGALSVLDVLEARRLARQARLDLVAARADLARAQALREAWILAERE